MKLVRFKKEYSDSEPRLSYELVSDEPEFNDDWCPCWNTKLLGLIPIRKLEEADGSELPAIDVFVKLWTLNNG